MFNNQSPHTCKIMCLMDFSLYSRNEMKKNSWKLNDMCKFPQYPLHYSYLKE